MSCRDWTVLRDQEEAVRSAREHLRVCPDCRRLALASDPTLVFSCLQDVQVDEAEIACMRERVTGARRLLAVTQTDASRARQWTLARRSVRTPEAARLGRVVAVAALPVLLAVLLWPGVEPTLVVASQTPAEITTPAVRAELSLLGERLAGQPLLDRLEGPAQLLFEDSLPNVDVVGVAYSSFFDL